MNLFITFNVMIYFFDLNLPWLTTLVLMLPADLLALFYLLHFSYIVYVYKYHDLVTCYVC